MAGCLARAGGMGRRDLALLIARVGRRRRLRLGDEEEENGVRARHEQAHKGEDLQLGPGSLNIGLHCESEESVTTITNRQWPKQSPLVIKCNVQWGEGKEADRCGDPLRMTAGVPAGGDGQGNEGGEVEEAEDPHDHQLLSKRPHIGQNLYITNIGYPFPIFDSKDTSKPCCDGRPLGGPPIPEGRWQG